MHPVLLSFHLGGTEVTLRAYGTFYVLAFAVAVALGTLIAWRRGIAWRRALTVFTGALATGVVGARLLDLVSSWGYYAEDVSRIFALDFRGFSLYGGLVSGLVAGLLLARTLRLPVWRLADSAVPALAVGIGLMRVGCFLNGCCFGTSTSLPWGITYPPGSPAWAQQLGTGEIGLLGFASTTRPVHPTQLYEIAAALLLGVLALWLLRGRGPQVRRVIPGGIPFLTFVLGFTLFRLGNQLLRAPSPSATTPGWFWPSFYVILCAGVAAVLVWRTRQAAPALSRLSSGDGSRVRAEG